MFSGRGLIVRSLQYLHNLRQTNYKSLSLSLFLLLCRIDRVSFTLLMRDKIWRKRDFAINLAYWRIDKNYRYRYIYYYYFQKKPTEFQRQSYRESYSSHSILLDKKLDKYQTVV